MPYSNKPLKKYGNPMPPTMAKSPYLMSDKKSGIMMSESPIMKHCGSKRYGKKK